MPAARPITSPNFHERAGNKSLERLNCTSTAPHPDPPPRGLAARDSFPGMPGVRVTSYVSVSMSLPPGGDLAHHARTCLRDVSMPPGPIPSAFKKCRRSALCGGGLKNRPLPLPRGSVQGGRHAAKVKACHGRPLRHACFTSPCRLRPGPGPDALDDVTHLADVVVQVRRTDEEEAEPRADRRLVLEPGRRDRDRPGSRSCGRPSPRPRGTAPSQAHQPRGGLPR